MDAPKRCTSHRITSGWHWAIPPTPPAHVGLTPFDLLPEQAVDLTLVWYWAGEPYASMGIGAYRFAIQVSG